MNYPGDFKLDQIEQWSYDFIVSKQFLSFLDLIPEVVIFSNTSGDIIQVNDNALAVFHYSRSELLKLSVEDLVPERFRKKHPKLRAYYFSHSKPRFLDGRQYDLFALKKDGSEFPMDAGLFAITTDQGPVAVNLIRDVTLQKKYESEMVIENSKLSHLVGVDALTNLPNRRYFESTLSQLLAKSKRHHRVLSLLFIDLDHFKPINDKLGHDVGDALLKMVAK